jgi:CRISPR/Cas system CSM-associated protein Csm3 (group 7 of RAMP superfamily)
MTHSLSYTLKLVSDAEPSSGFGTELINALIPRDINGWPFIPSSHIKGLLKQAVKDLEDALLLNDNQKGRITKVFGSASVKTQSSHGSNEIDTSTIFSLTDCKPSIMPVVKTVTRTALDPSGTAKNGALRTTETIAAGTEFSGSINFINNPNYLENLLVRYALLSIMEVGGCRNRGCGACFITIVGEENLQPGEVLKAIIVEMKNESRTNPPPLPIHLQGDPKKQVTLKLTFTADGPICVPELPVVTGNNVIRSGFTISSSAVQGIILHRIDALNKEIASACFESDIFRVWPLLPTMDEATDIPIRTSVSHKISKLPNENDCHEFCDELIEADTKVADSKNPAIKSADGVLIPTENGIKLWRSGDMARHISAHGVHNGDFQERNLFTVESLAVKYFCGIVVMPEDAANIFCKSLKDNPTVLVGKARSVRGSGKLVATPPIPFPDFKYPVAPNSSKEVYCFIVQTPLLIEGQVNGMSVDSILKEIVEKSRWGEVTKTSGSIQILFGWNRHKKGRQKAERVIAPGSVFELKEKPKNLEVLLVKGIGGGRERGFGAILPHPGNARELYKPNAVSTDVKSSDQSGKIGWELWEKADDTGLMPSQIAQVQAELANGKQAALDFLDRQQSERPAKIWDRWRPVIDEVRNEISNNPVQANKILKVWHDLAVFTESKGGRS